MEHESHHNHHPHGTGIRWLDISLGVAATVVSLVSLWLGLHSAHSMEKLVAANSYPYLELMRSTSTLPLAGNSVFRKKVEYELVNNGIGPARIEWVQLNFKGKPVRDLTELLDVCCAGPARDIDGINHRGGVASALVRPGSSLVMFTWNEPKTTNPTFEALHRQMNDITYSFCFCSVFDDCYMRADNGVKPEPVKHCTPPAVAFRPTFRP